MKKLYTLITITLFPFLTFSQTTKPHDCEYMEKSVFNYKDIIPTAENIRIEEETSDPMMVETITPKNEVNKLRYPPKKGMATLKTLPENSNNSPRVNAIVREEDYDENNN